MKEESNAQKKMQSLHNIETPHLRLQEVRILLLLLQDPLCVRDVRKLSIRNSEMDAQQVQTLAHIMRTCEQLEEVDVRGCKLSTQSEDLLLSAFTDAKKMHTLLMHSGKRNQTCEVYGHVAPSSRNTTPLYSP